MDKDKFERLRGEPLTVGKDYCYWNRSAYEIKASPKRCKLLSFDGKNARVFRYDLLLNTVQVIEISRIRLISVCTRSQEFWACCASMEINDNNIRKLA